MNRRKTVSNTTNISANTEQSEKQVAIQLGGKVLLRDYFAAKAMQGWLSTYPVDHGPDEVYEDGVAEFAYKIADAMLKARNES